MTTPLAQAGFGALDWSILVIGILIAALLILAFVGGSRRKRRNLPPPLPSRAPSAPDPDSWTTPEERATRTEAAEEPGSTERQRKVRPTDR